MGEQIKQRRASWLQFDAPHELASEVRQLQSLIATDDTVELEDDPHVTVLYGLHIDDPADVAPKLEGCGEVKWMLGAIGVFANRNVDILHINVISRKLEDLHYRLRDRFWTMDAFVRTYKPHVTIAKLRSGKAQVYANTMRCSSVAPYPIISRTIVLHTRDRKRYEIGLEE